MKLWVDDTNQPPEGMYWVARSGNEAKLFIEQFESGVFPFGAFESINVADGYSARLLSWLEETGRKYIVDIH